MYSECHQLTSVPLDVLLFATSGLRNEKEIQSSSVQSVLLSLQHARFVQIRTTAALGSTPTTPRVTLVLPLSVQLMTQLP